MIAKSPWGALVVLLSSMAAFAQPAGAEPVQVFVEDLKVELKGWAPADAEALGKALAADLQGAIVKNPAYSPMTFENLESQLRKEKRAEQMSCSSSDQACIQKILDNYGCEERLYGTVRQVGEEVQVTLTRYQGQQLVGNGAASDYAKPEARAIREVATRLAVDLFGGPRSTGRSAGATAMQVVGGKVSVGQAFDRGQAIQNALTDDAGFLTIATEPSGATLFLNGKEIGTSPKQLETMVGKYVVVAELGRLYHPGKQELELTTAGADLKLVLPAAFGSLEVTSTPSGAEVWLDNERVGTTPYRDNRRVSGTYPLRVTLGRYLPVEETVVVEDGKATSKAVNLEADFGELSVKSTPEGAAVWLNGEQVGTTPWESGPRAVGTYEIRIVAPLHLSYNETVQLGRGDKRSVDAGLQANYGDLTIASDPADVSITLNGKETGFKTPHTFQRLETGTYTIELSQAGYGDVADRATVKPLSTVEARLVLQAKLGWLSVMASYVDGTPCTGKVLIDGKNAGATPFKAQVTATDHDVKVTCDEGEGSERIRVEHNGKVSRTVQVRPADMASGPSSSDLVGLARRFVPYDTAWEASSLVSIALPTDSDELNRCVAFEKQKQYEKASECFRDYTQRFPDSSVLDEVLYDAAIDDHRAHQMEHAITGLGELYNRAKKPSIRPVVLFALAEIYRASTIYSEAAKFYEIFAANHPTHELAEQALMHAMTLRKALGEVGPATKDGQALLKRFPKSKAAPTVDFELGLLLLADAAKAPQAIAHFQGFVKRHPGSTDLVLSAWLQLGKVRTVQKKKSEAKKAFENVVTLYDSLPNEKRSALRTGPATVAEARFRLAAPSKLGPEEGRLDPGKRIRPEATPVYVPPDGVGARMSEAELKSKIAADPYDAIANTRLASLAVERGDYDEAIRFSRLALLQDSTNLAARAHIALAYLRSGSDRRALATLVCLNALQIDPNATYFRDMLGVIAALDKSAGDAISR